MAYRYNEAAFPGYASRRIVNNRGVPSMGIHQEPAPSYENSDEDLDEVVAVGVIGAHAANDRMHTEFGAGRRGGEDVQVRFRLGACLTARAIENAFTGQQDALKFAMPGCTIRPYDDTSLLAVETLHIMAMIAARGYARNALGDAEKVYYVAGNAYVVDLPDAVILAENQANEAVLNGCSAMRITLTNEERATAGVKFPDATWWIQGNNDPIGDEDVIQTVEVLALHITATERSHMYNAYVGMFLCYTCQGNISQAKLTKIMTELAGQQINLSLTRDVVQGLWARFGSTFGEEAASIFFPRWEAIFERHAPLIRLRLLFNQAAWTGLTGLSMIREMIAAYPDFPWHVLAAKYRDQWNRMLAAHRAVGENQWYGYRKDIGPASVRHYKTIAYCAKQIREVVQGDIDNMRLLMTAGGAVHGIQWVNDLIANYARGQRAVGEAGDHNSMKVILTTLKVC
ncbi:hypothetical protein JTE90_004171 [Oedothorax gibbosus]|uniref:Nucleoprotein n=1 Tax=Oedothorax gibbosus TaxID=931172 RepID=A0AAV6TVH7_9ARAC|nr:hypothetical protein JTE90_004171 [Oedothorax gibbosus]